MIRSLRALGATLLLTTSVSAAEAPLPQASEVSGYGSTRVGYTSSYSGACAPRVGMSIGYVSPLSLDDALPEIQQYAQRAAKHVVSKCPDVQTLEVNARNMRGLSPVFYRFLMDRSSGWSISDVGRSDRIISNLIESGYLPARGPAPLASEAYLRFDDERLDVVFGLNLSGRMAATHVEQHLNQVSDTQSVAHYIVRGDWYELAVGEGMSACEMSRDGYPLWGSFTMTVYAGRGSVNLSRKPCVDHAGDALAVNGNIRNLSRSDFRKLNVEPIKISEALAAALEKSEALIVGMDPDAYARVRRPLVDTPNYRLFSRKPDLCTHLEFDMVYRINHERRDDLFGTNFTQGIAALTRRVANEQCSKPVGASVRTYRVGEDAYWDSMGFRFEPTQQERWSGGDYLRRTTHIQSAPAKALDAAMRANLLGPTCGDAVFCELPGGRYLNAIYEGRLDDVRQMDHLYKREQRAFINRQFDEPGIAGLMGGVLNAAVDADESQLLQAAANKYMHSYPAWGEDCFDAGAVERKFEYTTPVVIETDDYGTTTTGGQTFSATYTLNSDFLNLRDKLASYRGAKRSDDPNMLPVKAAVFSGIVQMKENYSCRSAEVKELERQLRALTNAVIAEPGTVQPTAANRPALPEKVFAAPFLPMTGEEPTQVVVARVAPVSLSASGSVMPTAQPELLTAKSASVPESTASGAAPKSIAAMSPQEKYDQMSKELAALSEEMEQKSEALSKPLTDAMRSGASAATQQELMQEYQNALVALQMEMQEAAAQVQKKYR